MIADFFITFFSTGILICLTYIILQAKNLHDEKREMFVYKKNNSEKFEKFDDRFENKKVLAKPYDCHDDVFASIEEEI